MASLTRARARSLFATDYFTAVCYWKWPLFDGACGDLIFSAQRASLSSANVHDVALYTFARNLSRAITAALPPPLSARKRATQPRAHCNHARPKPQRRRRRRHR